MKILILISGMSSFNIILKIEGFLSGSLNLINIGILYCWGVLLGILEKISAVQKFATAHEG